MGTEEKSPESVVHRPLPAVEIPLLREHRRASRARQLAVGGAVALAMAGAITASLLTEDAPVESSEGSPLASTPTAGAPPRRNGLAATADAPAADSPASPLPPAAEAPRLEPGPGPSAEPPQTAGATTRTSQPFGEARGFRPALLAAGLEAAECAELEAALADQMDFRRCRPEHELIVERDSEGTLLRFEYHGSRTEYVLAERDAAGDLIGSTIERPVERIRVGRAGVVRSALGQALERAELGRALVGTFIEAFDRRARFQTQTRAGDTFRILLEEEHLDGRFYRYGRVLALEYAGQRTGRLRAFYFERRPGDGELYDEEGRAVNGGWLKTPCRFERISSRFDPRRMHPILRRIVPHNGVDYAAGTGTPVWAAAAGTITFAGERGANGNLVAIRHRDGFETFYAHLHRITRGIRAGVEVEARQSIGQVGNTGRSTGPHLHFGLKRNGRFVDPLAEINGPARPLPAGPLGRFRRAQRALLAELEAIAAEPLDSALPPSATEPEPDAPTEGSEELPLD